MKNRITILIALLFGFGLFLVNSCSLEDLNPDADTKNVTDNARAEDAIADAFGIMNNAATGNNKSGSTECYSVSYSGAYPKYYITITFPAGCVGSDGVVRSGKIKGVLTTSWKLIGSKLILTFDNYVADGFQISGTDTVTYVSNEGNLPRFKMATSTMTLTELTNQEVFTWKATKNVTWKTGFNTLLDRTDDSFEVSGTSTGKDRPGNSFSIITTGLVTSYSCKWPLSGKLDITSGSNKATINFGDAGSSCDNKVTYTKNGVTIAFELKN